MNILESCLHQDDRQVLINAIEHQQALTLELRRTVKPILQMTTLQNGRQANTVLQLFEDLLSSSSQAISLLQSGGGKNNKHGKCSLVGGKRGGGIMHGMENHSSLGGEEAAKFTGNKRRKNAQHTNSLVTDAPHYDGYQWRKYGQKWISKARHSRSYYRCANSKGQGCPATKTVQQMETHGSKSMRLFNVHYYGQHTCERHGTDHPYVVETPHHSVPPKKDHSQCHGEMVVDEIQQVQDESFEDLFIVPDMTDYLADIEMARAMGVTINFPMDPDPWELDNLFRCQQQSPFYMWGWD